MDDGELKRNDDTTPTTVVFDLGGVLIDWNPRHLYRRLFDDEAAMERFLAEVTTAAWNLEMDRGRTLAEAIPELIARHPGEAERIEAWRDRWPEMLGGPIAGTVEVLAELRARGVRLIAITNWSAETFRYAPPRFPFLGWFDGILVSGEVGLIKPDPAIFHLLIERYRLDRARTVYVDDSRANVEAASALGMRAMRFTDVAALRTALEDLGLLRVRPASRARESR